MTHLCVVLVAAMVSGAARVQSVLGWVIMRGASDCLECHLIQSHRCGARLLDHTKDQFDTGLGCRLVLDACGQQLEKEKTA